MTVNGGNYWCAEAEGEQVVAGGSSKRRGEEGKEHAENAINKMLARFKDSAIYDRLYGKGKTQQQQWHKQREQRGELLFRTSSLPHDSLQQLPYLDILLKNTFNFKKNVCFL